MAFSPAGDKLAGILKDGPPTYDVEQKYPLHIWEIPSGNRLQTIGVTVESVKRIAWSDDGSMVQMSGRWVHRFNVADGKELTPPLDLANKMMPASQFPHAGRSPANSGQMLSVGRADVGTMASYAPVSSETGLFILPFHYGTFQVFDRRSTSIIKKVSQDEVNESVLDLAPDGQVYLLRGSESTSRGAVSLSAWRVGKRRRVWKSTVKLERDNRSVLAKFAPSGRYIVLYEDDRSGIPRTVLDASTGKMVAKIDVPVTSVPWTFIPNEDAIAVGLNQEDVSHHHSETHASDKPEWSGVCRVRFISLANGKVTESIRLPSRIFSIQTLAVSSGRKRLAIGDQGGLRVWNVDELKNSWQEPPAVYLAG